MLVKGRSVHIQHPQTPTACKFTTHRNKKKGHHMPSPATVDA